MQPFELRNYILPMYLGSVLLLITPLTTTTVLCIVLPLVLTALSFSYHKKNVGILGMALFYLISLPQYLINSIDTPFRMYLLIFLVIVPSLFLLYQVLTNRQINHIFSELFQQKKAVFFTIVTAALTFISVYLISLFIGSATLFNKENIQGQILLLGAVSFLIYTPLLLRRTKGTSEE